MAVDKYLNKNGLSHVADYVNRKLTVVSSMPSSPSDQQTVLYIGTTTEDYVQGGIYLYDDTASEWIFISAVDVNLYETSWTGTQNEWNALSSDEQAKYEIVNFTDDFVPTGGAGVVAGYYYNGKFYEESTHTTEITGLEGFIYIDLTEQKLYLYDGTEFVVNSGEGGGVIEGYYYNGKFYEDSSHTIEITGRAETFYVDLDTNTVYRYDTTESEFVSISGGLTAGFGIKIASGEISTTDFVGTQAEWDNLTAVQKAEYDFIHITDDSSQIIYKPGHSISDGTTEKTQRDGLVFDGFTVTDDSTNEVTKIQEIPYTAGDGVDITNKEISVTDEISRTWTGTKAQWDAISDKTPYDGWVINITDDQTSGVGVVVDTVTDGNMNAVTSNAVYDLFNTVTVVENVALDPTYVSNGTVSYIKIGRLVIVHVSSLVLTSNASSSTVLATLPVPISPYTTDTKIRSCGWTSLVKPALIEVNSSTGAFTFGGSIPTTSEGIYGEIVYFTNE